MKISFSWIFCNTLNIFKIFSVSWTHRFYHFFHLWWYHHSSLCAITTQVCVIISPFKCVWYHHSSLCDNTIQVCVISPGKGVWYHHTRVSDVTPTKVTRLWTSPNLFTKLWNSNIYMLAWEINFVKNFEGKNAFPAAWDPASRCHTVELVSIHYRYNVIVA